MTTAIKELTTLEEWEAEWDALSEEIKTYKVSGHFLLMKVAFIYFCSAYHWTASLKNECGI